MEKDHLLKVLLIDNSVQVTGAYRSIRNISQELDNHICYYYGVPDGCWTRQNDLPADRLIKFRFLELRKSLSVILYFPMLLINTIKASLILRRHSIKVVHVNDLYNMVGVCLKLFHPTLKLVYHVRLRRGSYAKMLYNIWIKALRAYADDIICVSKATVSDIGISTPNVRLIHDAILNSWLAKATSLKQGKTDIQFLYVGNYIPGKGQDYALHAFEIVKKSLGQVRLKFLGGTGTSQKNKAYLDRLRRLVQTNRFEDFVEFSNYSENVFEEMSSCDVVLNFSESESFSMVCLEALACKRPVIATCSGGPEEIIQHEINGLLVKNRDVVEMADSMVRLASETGLMKRFSENAHIDFDHKFDLRTAAKSLLTVYLS